MKKIICGKIPARALVAVFYTNISILFFGGTAALSVLIAKLPQDGDRRMYVLCAITISLVVALASFFAGFEHSKRLLTGRAMRFQGLAWPGTVLPQSKSFFHFLGSHELGNGWVVATFQKITEMECIANPPREVSCSNLFCVLTRKDSLPSKRCLLRLEYDQRYGRGS